MKIRHERIREAMNAWALYPGGRKTPVSAIVDAYFSMGMTSQSCMTKATLTH